MKLFVWLALLQSAFSVKLRGLQDQTLLELVDGTTLGTAVELAVGISDQMCNFVSVSRFVSLS